MKQWSPGWYAVEGNANIQREWNGSFWTGATRPTKRILGVVVGGNPKKAHAAAARFHSQIQRLQAAQAHGHRGVARVAWITAYQEIDAAFGPDGPYVWNAALESIRFSSAMVESPVIASLATIDGPPFEVFEDFVIFGQYALDTNSSSHLDVYQDGQVQVTVSHVADRSGRMSAVRQTHDLRTAAIQLSGPTGTLRANIHPDNASNAHRLSAHFNAKMQTLSPPALTAAELRNLVDSILSATGQPAAEKIQQLDRLRYQRLINDDEWSQAKLRILGSV